MRSMKALLSNWIGATGSFLVQNYPHTLTIVDDDMIQLEFALDSSSVRERDNGVHLFSLLLNLSQPAIQDIDIHYSLKSASTTHYSQQEVGVPQDHDFEPSGIFNLVQGQSSIDIPLRGDLRAEKMKP